MKSLLGVRAQNTEWTIPMATEEALSPSARGGSVASNVTARRLLRAQNRSLVRTPKPVTGELVDSVYEGEMNEAG